jgi:phosphate starvation-inducible protein PhoH
MDYSRYGIDPERAKEIAEEVAATIPARTDTPAVKQAQQAVDAAEAYLDKVTMARGADGRSTYSFEDRSQAVRDLEARKQELSKASNDSARLWRENRDAAVKKAADDKRAAEQAQRQAEQDADLTARLRSVYLGSDAEFQRDIDSLKAAYYQRQALSQLDVDKAQMLARYGGRF